MFYLAIVLISFTSFWKISLTFLPVFALHS